MIRRSNIKDNLGGQNDPYSSIYIKDYPELPLETAKMDPKILEDLRSHHFKLGNGPLNEDEFTSEHHAEYVKKVVPLGKQNSNNQVKQMTRNTVNFD